MRKVTSKNYKKEKYFDFVKNTVTKFLEAGKEIRPVDLFIESGRIKKQEVEDWRKGRIPYLERVVQDNLSVITRILRVFKFHCENANLDATIQSYKYKSKKLRFCKNSTIQSEELWQTHYRLPSKGSKNKMNAKTKKVADRVFTDYTSLHKMDDLINKYKFKGQETSVDHILGVACSIVCFPIAIHENVWIDSLWGFNKSGKLNLIAWESEEDKLIFKGYILELLEFAVRLFREHDLVAFLERSKVNLNLWTLGFFEGAGAWHKMIEDFEELFMYVTIMGFHSADASMKKQIFKTFGPELKELESYSVGQVAEMIYDRFHDPHTIAKIVGADDDSHSYDYDDEEDYEGVSSDILDAIEEMTEKVKRRAGKGKPF